MWSQWRRSGFVPQTATSPCVHKNLLGKWPLKEDTSLTEHSMSGEKWQWETPESSWCQTCHREQMHAASEWRILILTSLVATPAFVHGDDAKGETQVITLPEPSSLCNRSLPLPKNRQSTGCTSSPSLTAQPLQTIPFVKLFQGEPSLQILHSAPSAGSKNVPLYLSERAHRLGNKAELGWWEWFLRIRVSIISSTVWRKKMECRKKKNQSN